MGLPSGSVADAWDGLERPAGAERWVEQNHRLQRCAGVAELFILPIPPPPPFPRGSVAWRIQLQPARGHAAASGLGDIAACVGRLIADRPCAYTLI